MVRVGVGQQLQIDDDVDTQHAGVRRHVGWTLGHQIARRQTSDQEDRLLPGPEPAQQRAEDTLAVHGVGIAVSAEVRRFDHQKPILSLRRCSASSLARPSARTKAR